MKLFWKQFIGILGILIAMFTIFGTLLLHHSFRMWLEREVDAALEDITMFQYAFLTSVEGVPENYRGNREVLEELVRNMEENIGDGQDILIVYNEEKEVLYHKGNRKNQLLAGTLSEDTMLWQMVEDQGVHYLETMSRVTVDEEVYYLERSRSLQYIYDNRRDLLRIYRITLLVLLAVSAVLTVVFALSFTEPIRRLSRATRAIAKGNYGRRVKSRGQDEIADLMEDFNTMAEKLEINIWELNDAVRRQEEFTGAFAHELKTPLTSIIGYSELLMSMELPEELRMSSAGYIYREGKRLERLAYKMMELTRLDKQELLVSEVSLVELLNILETTVTPAMQRKEITLRIKVEETLLWGDGDLLLSLLLNLVDNARKACDRGGLIEIRGKVLGNSYLLEIQDDGRGIPPEELPRITEAFYMVDKSRARKEGGAGLGMALCARILALHKGSWQMKSEPGKGTVIGIRFPGKEQG